MIYFDAHVHIQKNFSIDTLFDSARRNFSRQMPQASPDHPDTFFLLLTEAKMADCFADLKKNAATAQHTTPGGWQISATREPESLLLTQEGWPAGRLFLLAGRQIVTEEKLEVLALATPAKIPDKLSLQETVEAVKNHHGLAVLPWGAGKWLGKRGKIIDNFIQTVTPSGVFVGDNGGRPVVWPAPQPFLAADKRGIRLLPGSDPLPLPQEELRTGSYGGCIQGNCSNNHPAADLRSLLTNESVNIVPFGKRMSALQFLKTQIALRLKG